MRVEEELRLDRYKLDRYVTAATVLYLSPHYKQLAGSHVTAKLRPQTMFDELSARFQEVGV